MGDTSNILNEPTLTDLINEILSVGEGIPISLPRGLSSMIDSLRGLDFEKSKVNIQISSDVQLTETYFGEPKVLGEPVCEGEGVLLGQINCRYAGNGLEVRDQGFKLWLLRDMGVALHLFYEQQHTSGRLSGPGYTGDEETSFFYDAPLRKIVRIGERGEISLEKEVVAKEGYFFLCIGPTMQEEELRYDETKRDEFWRQRFNCPDGFIAPYDSIIIPDPQWVLARGGPFLATTLRDSEAKEGTYDTQGVFNPCYHYTASSNIRTMAPLVKVSNMLRVREGRFGFDPMVLLMDIIQLFHGDYPTI